MDLSTRYMGLSLQHPIVASASPMSGDLESLRQLEEGGVAAIVLKSLFEEQISLERAADVHYSEVMSEQHAEGLSYLPAFGGHEPLAEIYLEKIRDAVDQLSIPVIASLNCISSSGWVDYAARVEEAGASAIELNIYQLQADPDKTSEEIEALHLDILRDVIACVGIPVSMKLSPFFSAMSSMAHRLDQAGASGLVLFNRFYQPDLDIDQLEVVPTLELSRASEIRLPLLWISLLSGRVGASLAASTGVETSVEVVKYLLAGADVVMTTSALLRHGPGYARTLVSGMKDWMSSRGFDSVSSFRGLLSHKNVKDPSLYERANYLRILEHYARHT